MAHVPSASESEDHNLSRELGQRDITNRLALRYTDEKIATKTGRPVILARGAWKSKGKTLKLKLYDQRGEFTRVLELH